MPAAAPQEVVVRLHSEISAVVAMQDMRERMLEQGALRSGIGGGMVSAFVRAGHTKWPRVVM